MLNDISTPAFDFITPFNISQTVNQTYLEDASGEFSDCPSMKKFQTSVSDSKKKNLLAEYTTK